MTVDELRERLADLPGYYDVAVEVIVGGDLVTDDVDLVDVRVVGHGSAYVLLVPAPDEYGTRDLIDVGLAARAAAEATP